MVGLNIYIISLKNSPRRKLQEKQFSKLGLDFEFLDAISKDEVSNEEALHAKWERPLHLSEIACYKSHRNAWEKTASSNIPSLILEDDALISNKLPKIIRNISSQKNSDYINLENRNRKKIVSKKQISLHLNDNFSMLRLYHDSTGAAGYILYPKGAKKIIACESHYGFALADAQISRCNSLVKFQVEPALIVQLDMANTYGIKTSKKSLQLSQSTVSTSKKPAKSLNYLIKRITSQFKLGARKIYLSFFTERRYINTAPRDSFFLS